VRSVLVPAVPVGADIRAVVARGPRGPGLRCAARGQRDDRERAWPAPGPPHRRPREGRRSLL